VGSRTPVQRTSVYGLNALSKLSQTLINYSTILIESVRITLAGRTWLRGLTGNVTVLTEKVPIRKAKDT
jgi:hypothetical protein